MVPPENIFGSLDIRIGVFLALGAALAVSNAIFYHRVISLIMLGKSTNRFDQPVRRILRFLGIVMAQSKVLQRLSIRDKAGLGHVFVFWGFLSFLLSYVIFIFGDSALAALLRDAAYRNRRHGVRQLSGHIRIDHRQLTVVGCISQVGGQTSPPQL